MKRLALIAVVASSLVACSVDNKFEVEDGLCYRDRTEKAFFVITTSKSRVLAVPANCGLK